jgi:hypothetical protein
MRRNDMTMMSKIELKISECVSDIERMGAHIKLTQAQIRLSEAQNLVADYIESRIKE